jgi:hypothetical protein
MWVFATFKAPINIFFIGCLDVFVRELLGIWSTTNHIVGPLCTCGVFSCPFCVIKFGFFVPTNTTLEFGTQLFLLRLCPRVVFCTICKVVTQRLLTTFSFGVVCPCVFGQLLKVGTQRFLTTFSFVVVCPCMCIWTIT